MSNINVIDMELPIGRITLRPKEPVDIHEVRSIARRLSNGKTPHVIATTQGRARVSYGGKYAD